MGVPLRFFIKDLKKKYEDSNFALSQQSEKQIGFVASAIRDTSAKLPLRMAGTESITDAVLLAGKLGVDLDPSLGNARLTALKSPSTNNICCVLDLSLSGMLDAFSRVDGMKLYTLKSAHHGHQLAWKGDVMNASVSEGINTNQKTPQTLIGAICVIEVATGDRLPTTISKSEIAKLAELSNLSIESLPDDFALKHVFKRALKTLPCPANTQLGALQQATKLIDINLFEQSKLLNCKLSKPLKDMDYKLTQMNLS
ncbi:TPA: hypothetical protein ACGSTL_001372 [Vibrio parahaemolyticus]|uniref:hypothetical protein n=1 Tax=Vibrio campbellii TaxID=680 RepID=UPI001F072203|nr:hypothetical protein [Vibrio campbellii]UMM06817.1 hypothetical protein MKR81_26515 [Vibrio campbellii]